MFINGEQLSPEGLKKSESLSRFLCIRNTQKITHERLIKSKQKLDKLLFKEEKWGKGGRRKIR